MAVLIGRTKTWVWWLGGLLCALAFGSRAEAAEAVALYGIRARPPGPKIDEKAATEAQKKQAGTLVDEYLAGEKPAAPSPAETEQIAKLIADFGSADFATRKKASAGVLKFGSKAIKQLTEALKHKDAEVRQRASAAITAIRSGGGRKEVLDLRKIRNAAHVVIRTRRAEINKKAYTASLEARKLAKEGKKDEAAMKRAEASALYAMGAKLGNLYSLVIFGAVARPVGVKYGVRPKYGVMRMPPVQLKGAPGAMKLKVKAEEAKPAPAK